MSRSPRTDRLRLASCLTGLLVLTSACGLKSNAIDNLKTAQASGGNAALGGGNGAAGGVGGTAGGAAGGGSTATGGGSSPLAGGAVGSTGGAAGGGGSTGTTGTAGGTTGGAAGGPAAKPSGPCGVPTGGDTTGISKTTINIGLHAPLTGTGTPFPNSSFVKGAQVFFDQPQNKVCGRTVKVDFQDDTYKPAGANKVCSQFAKNDFLAIGGAGTDQIQACATNTDMTSSGTPYLSAGVTDNGLTKLSNYFAVSLTYQQQGGIVVRNALSQGFGTPPAASGGKKAHWAIVTASTPNFDSATAGIEAALAAQHISYDVRRFDQNGDYQAAAKQLGGELALDGYKTVFVDAAPGVFVFLTQGYYNNAPTGATSPTDSVKVHWTGPGVTFTDFLVAQLTCQASANQINGQADFLSPSPGIDRATPDFKKAFNNNYDDIEWGLWGLDQAIYTMLQQANSNLTRQNFIRTVQGGSFTTGAFAPAVFHGGHFGGTGAWVQRIDCSKNNPDQPSGAQGNGSWNTVGSTYLKP